MQAGIESADPMATPAEIQRLYFEQPLSCHGMLLEELRAS